MRTDRTAGREGGFPIRGASRASGFTLVEMLVVIVIVAILMGVVFQLSRGVMARNESARETACVAIFKSMIEDFHAEYGIYPPVPTYGDIQPVDFVGPFPIDGNDLTYYIAHYANDPDHPFQFGLISFLVDRSDWGQRTFDVAKRNGNPVARDDWEGYNDRIGDTGLIKVSEKDRAFAKRVWPNLKKLASMCPWHQLTPGSEFDEKGHTKGFHAGMVDSWWHSYVYVCEPPYTSYLIFSKGPDGAYDKDHPGDRTRPKNKDNIYGDLGDK